MKKILGISQIEDEFYLFEKDSKIDNAFTIFKSKNGHEFSITQEDARIIKINGPREDLSKCGFMSIAKIASEFWCVYTKKEGKKKTLCWAHSRDMYSWEWCGEMEQGTTSGVFVSASKEEQVFYYEREGVLAQGWIDAKGQCVLTKKDVWKDERRKKLIVLCATQKSKENIIMVLCWNSQDEHKELRVIATNQAKPEKLLWQSSEGRWTWEGNVDKGVPVGAGMHHNHMAVYWSTKEGGLEMVSHVLAGMHEKRNKGAFKLSPRLNRDEQNNPLMGPVEENMWESKAVFNPAVFVRKKCVHMIYRAIGHGDVSVFGWAVVEPGGKVIHRDCLPAYVPREEFEGVKSHKEKYHPEGVYASGGGCSGGCEDPKITVIDETVYLTYVAYDGWSPPRIAITSIDMRDFLARKWRKWKKPVILSPPGIVDKSAAILPKKIDGKYVIFHRVFPDILIDFVDSLDFDGKTWLKGEYKISPRPDKWDSRKLSVGAPPMETEKGWLVIYHGVDDKEDNKYRVGAMLLDKDDPRKVLVRSEKPILNPETDYENNGHKFGIVYPCGAAIIGKTLWVYYGGSDKYVCAAQAHLDTFLNDLINTGTPELVSISRNYKRKYVKIQKKKTKEKTF
ncbi:MAG: hypothetical protein KC736_02780 [Candidatus Moranbacteria bacterium]|nr:hypothetical protein [Candidatus Moranbacteria bacterium]